MSYIEGVVYEPPKIEYPHIVVFFKSNGEILAAHPAETRQLADNMLERIMSEVRNKLPQQTTIAS
jgi:hypothetical protein